METKIGPTRYGVVDSDGSEVCFHINDVDVASAIKVVIVEVPAPLRARLHFGVCEKHWNAKLAKGEATKNADLLRQGLNELQEATEGKDAE